jgi:methylmalonyl-CoA mutase
MTPEYGAPSQLEKIDMIDLADLVVLNKSDRQGADDALRDVRKQWRRNRAQFAASDDACRCSRRSRGAGTTPASIRLFAALAAQLGWREPVAARGARTGGRRADPARARALPRRDRRDRARLARGDGAAAERAADVAALERAAARSESEPSRGTAARARDAALAELGAGLAEELARVARRARALCRRHAVVRGARARDRRGEPCRDALAHATAQGRAAAHARLGRAHALPAPREPAGPFRSRRAYSRSSAATRIPRACSRGEGTPERTNRRFHLVSRGMPAARLSTAFDSVTLYGRDPAPRPDVYGKVGNSGVSVCTVDDAVKLYSGFDLCAPSTSVSMTINGPAPTVLAFFLNAAIDQGVERHLRETGRLEAVRARARGARPAALCGPLPPGHDGLGLALLGVSGRPGGRRRDLRADPRRRAARVRGTVQADILKEDQAQNTCIFSTEFSLQVMGDVQQ